MTRAGRLEFFTCELGIWLLAPLTLMAALGALSTLIPSTEQVSMVFWALWYIVAYALHIVLIVRRFHDLGRSGWSFFWLMVPLVNIYFILVLLGSPSTPENKWGAPPPSKVLWFGGKR